jgi:acetyl-CoA carboxylase alpha subunit
MKAVGDAIEKALFGLADLDANALRDQRRDRFYRIGRSLAEA